MNRDIKRFTDSTCDVLVIGGGINGAAIAHLSALSGLKVALLEKNDFASGTSSKSTKLIHGGLRYLENFEFGLVRESLKERYIQLKSAPHLVHPLSFIVPVYKNDIRPLWMIRLGVGLYDLLCGRYSLGKHVSLTKDEIIQLVPVISREGLLGGVKYFDARMDDARLCLENVLRADQLGAQVANYAQVKSLIKENGISVGVEAVDLLTQNKFSVRARNIVSCLGPWTTNFLDQEHDHIKEKVRTTKGVHIVYRGKISDHALFIPAQQDKRLFFIIPWMGNSLIGTTDTDFSANPDRVEAEDKDVQYLLQEAARVLPHITLDRANIITTFAGLRPLVHDAGHPSEVSRKHTIERSANGIVYVIGGKYTTYRKIAEDYMKFILNKGQDVKQDVFTLYGTPKREMDTDGLAKEWGVGVATVRYLQSLYGSRVGDVLLLGKNDRTMLEPICDCSPAIRAQVVYSIETEMARVPEDIIGRRLPLLYLDCPMKKCHQVIKDMVVTITKGGT